MKEHRWTSVLARLCQQAVHGAGQCTPALALVATRLGPRQGVAISEGLAAGLVQRMIEHLPLRHAVRYL